MLLAGQCRVTTTVITRHTLELGYGMFQLECDQIIRFPHKRSYGGVLRIFGVVIVGDRGRTHAIQYTKMEMNRVVKQGFRSEGGRGGDGSSGPKWFTFASVGAGVFTYHFQRLSLLSHRRHRPPSPET